MKILRILLIFFLPGLLFSADFPSPTGYVNDFAGIIDTETENTISELAGDLDRKSGAQLSVVTVKNLGDRSIEDYAWNLFEQWGIGEKGKDTGVLLLIALQERKIRIESGYGFEGAIPDGLAGQIIRDIITPRFQANDMNNGVMAGSVALLTLMYEEMKIELPENIEDIFLTGNGTIRYSGGKKKKSADFARVIMVLLIILFGGLRFFFLPMLMFSGRYRGQRTYGSFGSGFGGGFSGGGFGGFGGGFSGGGGASGGW